MKTAAVIRQYLSAIDRNHYKVLVFFLAFSILFGLFEWNRVWRLVDDQITVAAMVLKDQEPELFPNDPLLSNEYYKIYAPPVRAIIGLGASITGEIEAGHRLLVPVLAFSFLTTFYALVYQFTGSLWVGVLVSVAAVSMRRIIPNSFFGVLGVEALYARTFFLALAPLVILLFWRWRDSNKIVWAFLLLGIIANLHPTGGYTMTPMLVVALFLYRGFKKQTFVDIGLGLLLTLVGISPFIWDYLNYPDELLVDNGGLSAVALYPVSAESFAGRGYVFPLPMPLIVKSLIVGADVLLFSVLALIIRWRSKDDHFRFVIALAVGALAASLGGTAFLQFVSWLRGESLWYSELIRGTKWIYFALFLGTAMFFYDIGALISKPGMRKFYLAVFGCFLLFYPMISAAQIIRDYKISIVEASPEETPQKEAGIAAWLYRVGLEPLPDGLAASIAAPVIGVSSEEADQLLKMTTREDEDYDEIGRWIAENSAVDERVLAQNPHFKLVSERELGEQIIPDAIPEDVEACYETKDPVCLLDAAERHNAGYIVTNHTFPDLAMPVIFENITYRIYRVVP